VTSRIASGDPHEFARELKQCSQILRIVELSQALPIGFGEAVLPGFKASNNAPQPVEVVLVEVEVVARDRFQALGEVTDRASALSAAAFNQQHQPLFESLNLDQIP
jgi:hypothetical protein